MSSVLKNRLFVLLFSLLALAPESHGQLSKGHQILIDRGLQLQGLCIDDNWVTLSTYSNANYTSFAWLNQYTNDSVTGEAFSVNSSRPEWMGDPPGALPWSRWTRHETLMPPQQTPYNGHEAPYLSQLMAIQMGDEWFINEAPVRDRLVNWFIAERTNWPNTILYHNSWGSQISDANLFDFYTRAQPDMLSFDTYPWRSVYDIDQPNSTGPAIGGPPTAWYGDLRKYREHARGAGIPFAIYRQTFHAVESWDGGRVYRDPSRSELRLNTFAGLAFNAKFFTDYTYNTGANSFFERGCNWCGDSVVKTNGLFAEQTDVNWRAQKLGKALVRLTPITNERRTHWTTTMMFIRGKDGNGNYTPVVNSFFTTGTEAYTDWVYGHNDPYLTNNWVVTNLGTKNNGQPGEVIVSWFKPLDETFDGPDHTNEIYMMVVNGLTDADPNSTAADCLQEIKLNFHSSLGAVEMLNPQTGVAQLEQLPLVNGLRQLVLNLNGGDAALFKFANGAPFVGTQTTPVTGAPVITIHPASRVNVLGTSASFTTRAVGSAPLSYQWQFNGADISGATTNNFSRPAVQLADAGTYTVIVRNSSGSVTSTVATLSVNSSQPFFYEPFDYANIGSPVSSNTPANWLYGGTGTNDLMVASGSLSYSGLQTSVGNSVTNGGVGLGVRRLFGTNLNSGTVYFSALFRINNLGYGTWTAAGTATQVGALMAPDNSAFRLQIMVKSNSPTSYVIGVQKGGTGATATFDTTDRYANETVLLLGKYDFTTTPNAVSLWINPSGSTFGAESAPLNGFVTANTGLDGFTIDRFNIRQNTAASVPAAMQWDELRVGNSWAEVTPLAVSSTIRLINVVQLTDGTFQFGYTNSTGPGGSIYASTNLTNWTLIGVATETAPGTFQFTDSTTSNHVNRFYQFRSP